MKATFASILSAAILSLTVGTAAHAAVINFTGGTVYFNGGGPTGTTNNSIVHQNVDYYEQGGFRLDFIQSATPTPFATEIGDYYAGRNDVIHAHWSTGNYGDVTAIEITKIGGGTFDLNYFILTSNTDTGGAPASGNEKAYVQGYNGAVASGAAVLLPPEDWGFPATQIFLGSDFDAVDKVVFFVTNAVDCFGMDEFYIDEPAPSVPEPASLGLLALGLAGLAFQRRRK